MKAVLIVDINEKAYEEISKSEVNQMCVDIGYDYTEDGWSFHRPNKLLSLKPLPQKKEPNEEWFNEYHRDEFADGWNACLNEIIGRLNELGN